MTKGRERAGKTLEGFDVVPAVPAAVVNDPAEPYAAMRKDLLPYFGLPFYRAMLERSGFGAEIEAFDAAAGDVDAMQAAISERFLNELTAVGDDTAVRTGIERYRAGGCDLPLRRADPEDGLRGHAASRRRLGKAAPIAKRPPSDADGRAAS